MAGGGKTPDVCIIGAGLVGGLMAYELATRGFRVVILEAGQRFTKDDRYRMMERGLLDSFYKPWESRLPGRDDFTISGDVAVPLNDMRAKGVGGSTLHWGANALRLVEADFRMKSLYGIADDWPVSYQELEPYYGRAEQMLGVAGSADNPFAAPRSSGYPFPAFPHSYVDQFFEKACRAVDVKLHQAAYARNIQDFQGRPRCSAFGTCGPIGVCPTRAQYTAETHIDLALATGNVTLVTEATVTHLNTNAAGKLESVSYALPDRSDHEQAAGIFILAAHTVESTRLLLQSTSSRFPHGVANSSGLVGRNFMEHPGVFVKGRVKENTYPFRIGFHTAESHQFVNPPNRAELAGVKLAFTNLAGPRPEHLVNKPLWGNALAAQVREEFGRVVGIYVQLEQLPDPKCYVALDNDKKDCFGKPVPHLAYSLTDYCRYSLDEHVTKLAVPILEAMGAVDISRGHIQFPAHHLGTCRMGLDPAKSVVDSQCRAHDVENLFIVGGSTFVTGAVLQPSLTIAALALRAADFIGRAHAP